MRRLLLKIRYKLAQWHKKRFQKLMAKCLGAERYYKYAKCNLNSVYGLCVKYAQNDAKQVREFLDAYKSGVTHADMSSAYPRVMRDGIYPNIYADTDSLVNQEGNKNEM